MARPSVEINSGSMADISFLLLTFFLLTSSIDTDLGILRKLPPPLPPDVEAPDVNKRNVLNVRVNKYDQLMVSGKPTDINSLRQVAKDFLSNPTNSPDLSESKIVDIPNLGKVPVTKGIISLKNDRGTSYEMYIKVQDELTAAVNELRDQLSKEKFGVPFAKLTNVDYSEAVSTAVPVAISEAEPENIGGK
jgi:biopolymer transport protein ExbD